MVLKYPILYCGYNRINYSKKSIKILSKIKAKKIYICLDGPKKNKKDYDDCKEVRDLIKNTKFRSKVILKFRKENLGCKYSMSKAITWFFKNEKAGIILEDDIIPSLDFFKFCEYGLNKYKDTKDIGMICGTNYKGSNVKSNRYFYSKHFLIWGWATWRRVWKKYDVEMKDWKLKKIRSSIKKQYCNREYQFLSKRFNQFFFDYKDTWDIQWYFLCIRLNLLCVMPEANLVTNIGTIGTHSNDYYKTLFLKHGKINIHKLIFPKKISRDFRYDNKINKEFNFKKNIFKKIYFFLKDKINE